MKNFERVLLFILQSVRWCVLHRHLDTNKYKLLRSELIQKKSSPFSWQISLKLIRAFWRQKYLFLRKKAQVSLSLIRKSALSDFAFLPLTENTLGDASSRIVSVFPS